jgi:peptidylprolyl isomerase
MAPALMGNTVKIHYTGRLDDGTVFDSTRDQEPLEFKVGTGQVITGLEVGIVGMNVGDKRTVRVTADQGYGHRREELVVKVDRDKIPAEISPEVGQRLQLDVGGGQSALVMVTDVSETTITTDANHPLAGKDLTFEVEMMEIL